MKKEVLNFSCAAFENEGNRKSTT